MDLVQLLTHAGLGLRSLRDNVSLVQAVLVPQSLKVDTACGRVPQNENPSTGECYGDDAKTLQQLKLKDKFATLDYKVGERYCDTQKETCQLYRK